MRNRPVCFYSGGPQARTVFVGAGFKPALCSKQRPDGEGRFETRPYGIWVAVGSKRGGQRLDSLSQCHCAVGATRLLPARACKQHPLPAAAANNKGRAFHRCGLCLRF